MRVSVITPTSERARYLQGTYALLKQQTHTDWEWLVYDSSLRPSSFSDPRVITVHDDNIVSIGEKRNRLVERAKGDLIVHFDDDDFYAPNYLKMVIDHLQKASFFKLASWFSYDTKARQFFYWDTAQNGETRYVLNALSGIKIREIDIHQQLDTSLNDQAKKGYGFSFAYHRELFPRCHFADADFCEDRYFYEKVVEGGFPHVDFNDQKGEVIHVIHDSNTSTEYPQYRIPRFLMEPLAPHFFPYLAQYHES